MIECLQGDTSSQFLQVKDKELFVTANKEKMSYFFFEFQESESKDDVVKFHINTARPDQGNAYIKAKTIKRTVKIGNKGEPSLLAACHPTLKKVTIEVMKEKAFAIKKHNAFIPSYLAVDKKNKVELDKKDYLEFKLKHLDDLKSAYDAQDYWSQIDS